MNNTYIHFLNDTIKQLIELSKEVDKTDEYNKGIIFGYYSAISRILSQLESFDIIDELDEEIKNFIPEIILK